MDNLKTLIPSHVYQKILECNLNSASTLLLQSDVFLQQRLHLTTHEVKTLRLAVSTCILNRKFSPVSNTPAWTRITTGCNVIDSITRGGMPINGISEIVGLSGVGKTQLCLQLAITVQLPISSGGLNKGAVYICTEDVFPSKRILQIITNYLHSKGDDSTFTDNIFLEHISDYDQLRRCCQIRLPHLLAKHKIGLIVIDSIAGIFRSDNVGINYTNRSREFNTITSSLNELCFKYGVAVVVTNQVVDNIITGKLDPCLGLAWSNLITCRFWISRHMGGVRSFEIIFAPDLQNAECQFVIKSNGIQSAT